MKGIRRLNPVTLAPGAGRCGIERDDIRHSGALSVNPFKPGPFEVSAPRPRRSQRRRRPRPLEGGGSPSAVMADCPPKSKDPSVLKTDAGSSTPFIDNAFGISGRRSRASAVDTLVRISRGQSESQRDL
jgi:hypothetical protein